jgi:hypothetical protein
MVEFAEFLRDRLSKEMSRLLLKFRMLLSTGIGIVAVLFPGMDGISTRLAVSPGSRVGE